LSSATAYWQRKAFIPKDETDKEQISHIDVQWSVVSRGFLMSIEVGILHQINFEDLVTEFSKKKEWNALLLWSAFSSNTDGLFRAF